MEGVHNPHDDFVNSQWVEIGNLQQHGQQPLHTSQHHDFGSYGFVESPGFVPPESPFRLQQPPVPIAPNYIGMQQWGQAMMPPTTSHAQFIASTAIAPPPVSSAPLPASVSTHTTQSTSSPRRTLTDADRRRMCIFHEENPNVKQTEIGAMFGVERSTVSKVLRQKEKYLFPDDGSRSPVKRSKGKFPDIERALSVWAKNTRKQGIALTDMMIREKARFFATSVGMSDSHFKANSTGWLEKFKQKNNLHPNGRGRSESDVTGARRGSAPGDPASAGLGHARTGSTTTLQEEGSNSPMMVSSKSQDSHHTSKDSPDSYYDFAGGFKAYQQQASGSASATSVSSMFTDSASSFTTGPASPASPFFSPDHRIDSGRPSPVFPSQQARMPNVHQRPRSQTFPLISVDPTYISPPPSSEPLTPKISNQTIAPPPPATLASPANNISNPLGSPRDTPTSPHNAISSLNGILGETQPPPTKDDARRALGVVMSYLRQQPVGFAERDDYVAVQKLLGMFGFDEGSPMETDSNMGGFPGLPP